MPQALPSVIVVTRDNLPLLRLCLESVLAHTPSPAIELVVVDNASSDGTPAYLDELARRRPEVAVVRNRDNRGFPAAANQGLARAAGEVLVLMNDDVAVAPEWLARLAAHLRDPGVGLVGPATNRIGNEAEVETGHRTWGGFLRAAAERAAAHDGATFALPTPAMFCVAIARDAHERVGPLDERFGVGTLEDDDYALRVRAAGLATVGAEDVLVHHVGEASFGRLVPGGERDRVLEENRRRFEEKWGRPWRPYGRRPAPAYAAMRQGLRDAVAEHVPPGATVLVVSRGDEALLALDGRCGWHFPQTDGGVYAGHHPADSADAIAQLEAMRRRGGEFLAIPETGRWWLDHYAGLRGHLDARYRRVLERDGVGVLFALGDGGGPG